MFKGIKFADLPYAKETCLQYQERYPMCAHAVSLLVDMWEEENTSESLQHALQVFIFYFLFFKKRIIIIKYFLFID